MEGLLAEGGEDKVWSKKSHGSKPSPWALLQSPSGLWIGARSSDRNKAPGDGFEPWAHKTTSLDPNFFPPPLRFLALPVIALGQSPSVPIALGCHAFESFVCRH